MSSPEKQPERPRTASKVQTLLVCAIVFSLALAVRVIYASSRPIPVSADTAYYLMVARNLYSGRGFVSDYVWNYLAGVPEGLPVPSNEYWMPGTSVVLAGTFSLARETSLRVAQWPSLLFGALLCAVTAWIAGTISGRRSAAVRLIESGRSRRGFAAIGALAAVMGFGSLLYWWAHPPADTSLEDKPLYPPVAAQAVQELGAAPAPALTDNAWGLYDVAAIPCAQFPSDGAAAALTVADAIGAGYLITQADAPKTIPAMREVLGHPRFRPLARYPAGDTTLLVYRITPSKPARPQSPSASRRRMSQ